VGRLLVIAIAALAMLGSAAWAHKDAPHAPPPAASASAHGALGPAGVAAHSTAEAPPATFAGRLVDWLGRWHPSVVHFPVALFIVAGVLEGHAIARRRPQMVETTRVLVALGALGAVAAVTLGWMAMGWNLAADEPLERYHRFIGTAIAPLALAAWWAYERFVRHRGRAAGMVYGGLLVLTVVAIAVNGYLGGALIHGADHLAF
jgi:uncharacterized membrane protein